MKVTNERIDGVSVKNLKPIPDARGRLIEILRRDDELFEEFGQVYVTTAYPGVVKAWHAHEKQKDNIVCLKGMIKLVLYDDRESSPTRGFINEFFIGDHNPTLVHVPKRVWHGFMTIGTEDALVLNIPTNTYDRENPDELRKPPHGDVDYDWRARDK
jgi:dTDP-4-dehydrorhamnose 3,5-epimerase